MNYKLKISDWTQINIESAKFIFYQSENFLKSTVETSNSLTSRASTIIQILIPLIGFDFIYILTFFKSKCYTDFIFHITSFILVVLCLCLYKAIRMYKIVKVADVGSEPSKLATENLLLTDIDNQELIIVLNEIENYQDRIELNMANNTQKATEFRGILNSLIFGFALSALYALLAFFFWL